MTLQKNSSSYRGVKWSKAARKWKAEIQIKGKTFYLGLFLDEIEAAHRVDDCVMQESGDYWRLNFPNRYEAPTEKMCKSCAMMRPICDFRLETRANQKKQPVRRCRKCDAAEQIKRAEAFKKQSGVHPGMKFRLGLDTLGFFRILTSKILSRTKRSGLPYDISAEFLVALYERQQRRCALTGQPMVMKVGEGHLWNGVSVDRIDSNQGYTQDNVQLVCFRANQAKSSMSMNEFIDFCCMVADYQRKDRETGNERDDQ